MWGGNAVSVTQPEPCHLHCTRDFFAGMARKRKSSTTTIVRQVPVLQRGPAPIIRVQSSAPRAPKAKRRRSRGRSKGGGGHAGLTVNHMLATTFGGFALGFINKSFPSLPTLPIIGRSGTIAIGAYFLAKHMGGGASGILRDVAMAGAAVAGFELGTTGKVAGDVDGDLAPQVSGVAAQV